jgi:hypothetical protein
VVATTALWQSMSSQEAVTSARVTLVLKVTMGEFCVEGMAVGDAVGARLGLTGCRVGVLVVGM